MNPTAESLGWVWNLDDTVWYIGRLLAQRLGSYSRKGLLRHTGTSFWSQEHSLPSDTTSTGMRHLPRSNDKYYRVSMPSEPVFRERPILRARYQTRNVD